MPAAFKYTCVLLSLVVLIFSCKKEGSVDSSGGQNNSNSLIGNWKLLYITASGHEEGAYAYSAKTYKEIYDFKDSTIDNNGLFSFSKDSLNYAVSFTQSGKDWDVVYENGIETFRDSSTYNEQVTDAGKIPYKIKGDSITMIDDSNMGMFGSGIPATYKYVVNGNKLTLYGRFKFSDKDTLPGYVETFNVDISANIYLQKQ